MLALFVLRFFVFHLYESPKFLMGRGRDAEAVEVVHSVAQYNGTTSSLTLDMLREAERKRVASGDDDPEKSRLSTMDVSGLGVLRRTLKGYGWNHVTPLFKTRKLAWSTSLLIALWGDHSYLSCFCACERSRPFFSTHRPRFPTVRHSFLFPFSELGTYITLASYNSFITYLYG
jgi:hypothetical protein